MYNGKVMGVAGFVIGGCGSSYPDGYAEVAYHYDWIERNINENEDTRNISVSFM